jgi:hypothetical protein
MAYPVNAINGCPHKHKSVIAIALHIQVPSLLTYYDDKLYRITHKKRRKKKSVMLS